MKVTVRALYLPTIPKTLVSWTMPATVTITDGGGVAGHLSNSGLWLSGKIQIGLGFAEDVNGWV